MTYKTAPVDAGQFLRAWDASFDWDMMQYPLLARVSGDRQLYLNDRRLQVRSHDDVSSSQLADADLVSTVSAEFGIDGSLVSKALSIIRSGAVRKAASRNKIEPQGDEPSGGSGMGSVEPVQPVQLFVALLWSDDGALGHARDQLAEQFGEIEFEGPDRLST